MQYDEWSVASCSINYLWHHALWRVMCGIMQYDELSVASCIMTRYLWYRAEWRVICGIMLYNELDWYHARWRVICGISVTSYLLHHAVWQVICGIMLYGELSLISCNITSYPWYQSLRRANLCYYALWRATGGVTQCGESDCDILRWEDLSTVSISM